MPIRIIDHKKIEMTNDEFNMYENICRSYDRPNFKGEELFRDHFESNNEGIIIFVKPPNNRYSSMEVYCFIQSIMVNQHLRIIHKQADSLISETKGKVLDMINEIKEEAINQIRASGKEVKEENKLVEKPLQVNLLKTKG